MSSSLLAQSASSGIATDDAFDTWPWDAFVSPSVAGRFESESAASVPRQAQEITHADDFVPGPFVDDIWLKFGGYARDWACVNEAFRPLQKALRGPLYRAHADLRQSVSPAAASFRDSFGASLYRTWVRAAQSPMERHELPASIQIWSAATSALAPLHDIRTWLSSSVSNAHVTTSADLISFAERRLAELVDDERPTAKALESARYLLRQFVEDDGPTPQVGPSSAGGIEIQWLSGGYFVSAIVEPDGSFNLYALNDERRELFDVDGDFGQTLPQRMITEIAQVLRAMALTVKSRPAYWV